MKAAALLARAEAAGVTIEANGDRLRLMARAPAPTDLLHELAGAKAALLALLERRADEAAERAAIQDQANLPRPDTPERDRSDRDQRAMLAGLLAAAESRPTEKTHGHGPEQ